MRLPYLTRRWERAERQAEEAERRLSQAKEQHRDVRKLVEEAKEIKRVNGFAEAIRVAMGVPQ